MDNPRIRGLVFFVVGLIVAWFACVWLPFTVLPNAGLSVALPVIQVPGESVHYGWWFWGGNLTNTFIGGFLAGLIVLLWAGLNYWRSNGWTREIPGRGQAWTEIFVETFYDFCEGLGGEKFKKAPLLWPLVAAIFIFLLAGNWMKLLPGMESVGYVHCAYVGQSGYARYEGAGNSWRLWVDQSLDAGTTQTDFLEEECVHFLKVSETYYGDYDPAEYEEERIDFYSRLAAIGGEVPAEYEDAVQEAGAASIVLTVEEEDPAAEEDAAEEEPTGDEPVANNVCELPGVEDESDIEAEADLEAPSIEGDEGDTGDEAEAAPTEEAELETEGARNPNGAFTLTSSLAVEEPQETASVGEVRELYEDLVVAEEDFADGAITAGELEEISCAATQAVYPNAVFPLTSDELQEARIQPYIFALTPFVRGVATDLSFNFGLAILSVVIAVQAYGVMALGPAYFEKFINISALGNLGKKPMGLIDFVVGLIEIISEIGKIISLAFRLFGNIFAGGIVLMVFPFLLAFLVPGIMIVLEIIIGFVQALVFAVLTLVFSVQAMEAHHGDEHDDEHH